MNKMRTALSVVTLLTSCVSFFSSAENNNVPHPQSQKPDNAQTYEIKQFYVDYKPYSIGDTLPNHYLEKQYQVTEWQSRHLTAPQEGSHWAYLNGNYVLLSKRDGKVLQAVSGDIYFR